MENRQEHYQQVQYIKKSSLAFLRSQEKAYKHKINKQSRMIRRRKHLKEHIYKNSNIFQLPDGKFSRKAAQNIIWQKNYKLKMAINIFRQENSYLKAKLWNIEKQNRKMDKQIQSWNLQKVFVFSNKKPYIDMATVSKVFADQDYQIVSIKIDIAKYEGILRQKQIQIERLMKKQKQSQKNLGYSRHMASQAKLRLLTALKLQNLQDKYQQFQEKLNIMKNQGNKQIMACTQKLDLLKKNVQIKKKINLSHLQEKQSLEKQHQNFESINEDQIESIKQTMRRIKIQEQNSIKNVKKSLKAMKRNNQTFQCEVQEEIGEYILNKIQITKQIQDLIKQIQDQFGDLECYKSEILPKIRKLQ